MKEMNYELIVKVIKARIDDIAKTETEKFLVWNMVSEVIRAIIPNMMMLRLQGIDPDKFLETLRAIVDGIDLTLQEAKKSND